MSVAGHGHRPVDPALLAGPVERVAPRPLGRFDPGSPVRLCEDDAPGPAGLQVTTGVGISRAVDRPWRPCVQDSPWRSAGRPAGAG